MIVPSTSRHPVEDHGRAPAYVALAGLLALGSGWAGVLMGCGAPVEGDNAGSDISPFNPAGNGGTAGRAPASRTEQHPRCASRESGEPDSARTLETCNAAGTAFDTTQCGAGSVCYSGQCQPLSCKAGESVCLGEEIHTCNADEKSTTLLRTCNTGPACSPATRDCAPRLCEPPARGM